MDLRYCQKCRSERLAREASHRSASIANNEAIATQRAWEAHRDSWDTRVIAPDGREVWALDLAAEFRRQTVPQPILPN